MKRLLALIAFACLAVIATAQAQVTPSPAPTPQTQTNYQTFHVTLGVPTTGPVIETQTAGQHVCAVVLNYPFSSAFITPQGSDDYFTWHALTTIGQGSITMPGLYIGPNSYKYFRPYFTQFNFPGATGWEACADDESALIAPMLNGQNGVLNNYQQITAIGDPGCAVFDSGGNLRPQGGGLPCAGGGGSTCANPPSPYPSPSPLGCVVLQDTPSPAPQQYNDGQGSAAVAGILQGGTVYSQFGRFQTTGNFLIPCPAEDCVHWQWQSLTGKTDIATTYTGPFSETEPSTQNSVPGVCFGWGCPNANVMPVNNFGVNIGAGVGNEEIYLDTEHRPDGVGRANVVIGSFGSSGSGSVDLQAANISLRDNEPGGVTPAEVSIVGDVFVQSGGLWDNGPNPQSGTFAWAGHCRMSSGTTCSITTQAVYTSSLTAGYCNATAQGSTPIAAACAMSGTTATVTAASSNSLTWAVTTFGAASP